MRTLNNAGHINELIFINSSVLVRLGDYDDYRIIYWDIVSDKMLKIIENNGANKKCYSLAISYPPVPQILVGGFANGTIKFWNASNGKLKRSLNNYEGSRGSKVTALAFTHSLFNDVLASGYENGIIQIWNTTTGHLFYTLDINEKHVWYISSLAFNKKNLLASASWDKTIKLWNIHAGKLLKTLIGHTGSVESVAFSNGIILASASWDNTIKLWNINTGALLNTLKGHSNAVQTVTFNQKDVLASGSYDKTIKLWDIYAGKLLETLTGHEGYISSLAFLEMEGWKLGMESYGNGSILASAGNGWYNNLKLWAN
jgi:WD40 repeat protein